jgi:short-subunit dehydrogenase
MTQSRAGEGQPTVFISGAAQGIGLATAKHFAARGYFVGMSDIKAEQLAQAQSEVGHNTSATYVLDVRDRKAWTQSLSDFASRTGGRIDVLINNAGLTFNNFFDQLTDDEIDLIIDVNVKGVLNGARAGLDYLKASKGTLVNIASCAAFIGSPKYSVYSTSKAAVKSLSEALDIEFTRFDVKVRCILPWSLETPILDSASTNSDVTLRQEMEAVGQAIYPVEDAAEMIWRALHEDKLHYIVGQAGEETAARVHDAFDEVRGAMKAAFAPPAA